MCGIFGVINFDGQPVDKAKVLSARDILTHRGPDDSGIYFSSAGRGQGEGYESIVLSHRRLSIIDLSPSGHQPMVSDNGRYVIVFNGEIYNFEEIKSQVSNRQPAVGKNQFRTNSDTEVILKLFELEGPECLKRLRGMFAFAIWDDKEKKLFAARDRFGIKPFYYLHNNRELIFSSELKAIKKYKNGLTLSMEGMDAFLRTGSVPAPLTIYEETKALLPGHWMEVTSHPSTHSVNSGQAPLRVTEKQYWSFFDLIDDGHTSTPLSMTSAESLRARQGGNDPSTSLRMTQKYDDEAKRIIRNSLLDAVKAHMVSDVEVGAFLSGGIDSTAIVSLMRQVGQEKIKTISVTFPGNKLDESKYSNIAAKKYETDHFEYRLQEDELINDFDKIIDAMDQPTIDGINTYFVSKAAASFGLKVVLSGIGGDELFGGYSSFINIPRYQKIKSLPLAKPLMKAAGFILNGRLPAKAIEYFKNPDTPNAEYRLIRGLFTNEELKTLGWQQSTNQAIKQSYNPPDSMIENDWMNNPSTPLRVTGISNLVKVSCLESCVYMRNQLLRDSDVFSMAHSLELRVPFVDHLLYGSVLPYLDSGFNKSFPKKILVDAVGDLPDEIVHRPKQGFTFPFADWIMTGQLKDLMIERLNDLKNTLSIDHSSLDFSKLHWSRLWALFIASRFGE